MTMFDVWNIFVCVIVLTQVYLQITHSIKVKDSPEHVQSVTFYVIILSGILLCNNTVILYYDKIH